MRLGSARLSAAQCGGAALCSHGTVQSGLLLCALWRGVMTVHKSAFGFAFTTRRYTLVCCLLPGCPVYATVGAVRAEAHSVRRSVVWLSMQYGTVVNAKRRGDTIGVQATTMCFRLRGCLVNDALFFGQRCGIHLFLFCAYLAKLGSDLEISN